MTDMNVRISVLALGTTLSLVTILGLVSMNPVSAALPTEDEIMAEIDKEAEKINDIMNQKIEGHPGMELDGYCYDSTESLEGCTNEIAKEMEPYYDEAGERVWENIDNTP
jgi:hypothetical protein